MKEVLEIDGKELQPVKKVAKEVSYSRDYITRLAREGKIVASNIDRQWFVDATSLKRYIESATAEREIRKQQLRVERKRERRAKEAVERQQDRYQEQVRTLHVRSVAAAASVLVLGLVAGFSTYQVIPTRSTTNQAASTAQVAQSAEVAPKESLVAHGDRLASGQLDQEVRSIGDTETGVLLLPEGAATTTVEGLFSDPVVVRELPDGTQAVVRIDTSGEAVGVEMPLVLVPVKREKN